MPRGKIHTYDLYRLTEGKKVMVAENVSRKILIEQYGLPADKILYIKHRQYVEYVEEKLI